MAIATPYIPAILQQAAQLDNIDILELVAQAMEFDFPAQEAPAEREEIEIAEAQAPTLPLLDANGLHVRHVTEREAQQLVDRGAAVGSMANGWDSTRRSDLPWIAVRLVVPRDVLSYSNAALDHLDAENVAGLHGDSAAALASREKLKCWPEVGDERAPQVVCRKI